MYGKTSDHVFGLQAVLLDEDVIDTGVMPVSKAEVLAACANTEGNIYRIILESCREKRQLVFDTFPKLNRFLTGYDLRHVLSDNLQQIDLTRILCGSKGTLAFITEAQLNITPIPKIRRIVNIKYDSFETALCNAPFIVEPNALSVETIDLNILTLAKEDIVWHSVKKFITDVPDKEMLSLNIVEFAGNDKSLIDIQVMVLCQQLDELITQQIGE